MKRRSRDGLAAKGLLSAEGENVAVLSDLDTVIFTTSGKLSSTSYREHKRAY